MKLRYSEEFGWGVNFTRKDGLFGIAFSRTDLDYWLGMKLIDNLDYVEILVLLKSKGLIK